MSRSTRYYTARHDVVRCAWCQELLPRTKQQADRQVRYHRGRCAAYGRDVVIPRDHYRRMALASHRSRVANRLANLSATVAGLSAEEAYQKGYRSGYAAGKARRRRVSTAAA